MALETLSEGKTAILDIKGRTVNGNATVCIGGELTDLTITFEDGSLLTLKARGRADWPDAVIEAEFQRAA